MFGQAYVIIQIKVPLQIRRQSSKPALKIQKIQKKSKKNYLAQICTNNTNMNMSCDRTNHIW